MMSDDGPGTYSFESCVVDVAAREIRLRGTQQAVAPRVFDLIAYLIAHRDRVVTKDELLDNVWRGAILSDSVIARTVTRARLAVGDRADEPSLIRTIHRVGYRFVAVVVAGDSAAALTSNHPIAAPRTDIEAAPNTERLRLAVLPFENRTGDKRLAWVELGLMSLVNQALGGDARLHVASVPAVLGALELEPAGTPDDASRVQALSRLIGAQCICSVTMTKTADGIAFDYRLSMVERTKHSGRLQGVEPTTLCRELIRRITTDLFDGEITELRLQSEDPWVNQAVDFHPEVIH